MLVSETKKRADRRHVWLQAFDPTTGARVGDPHALEKLRGFESYRGRNWEALDHDPSTGSFLLGHDTGAGGGASDIIKVTLPSR